jgi:sulfur carrier protein
MIVKVNSEIMECSEGLSLSDLLKEYLKGKSPEGIAVALNSEIVFKQKWSTTFVKENDEVEIVHAVQGG